MLFVGDDWAQDHHDVELQNEAGRRLAQARLPEGVAGIARLHAMIGGFHLTGAVFEPIIGPTVTALREMAPDVLVPAHCTGWGATHALAARFPKAFIQNSVGTSYDFAATEP